MIKNWHKWFVCIFAVLFVSVFFVFDSIFFYKGSDSKINSPIIADEDIIEEDINKQPTKEDSDNQDDNEYLKPSQTIPNYTNGYECLNDALAKLDDQKYYTCAFKTTYKTTNIIDFNQTIEGTKYFNDVAFASDIYIHCNSSLGKTNYERIITEDRQKFVAYFANMDSKFNYDINTASIVEYDTESFPIKFPERLLPIVIRPQKGIDKLTKFDKYSNKSYYLLTFSLNISKIPDSFFAMMKKNIGASSVDYKSYQITFYISKQTGLIDKLTQTELFYTSVSVLEPKVKGTTTSKFAYYNREITPNFKN